eukprot:IDg17838t1
MKAFSAPQDAVRKDVERTIGVLIQSFKILAQPCCLWDKDEAMALMRTCVILQNMNREERRDFYNVNLHARAKDAVDGAQQFAQGSNVQFE